MPGQIYAIIDTISSALVRDHLPALRRFMLALDLGEVVSDEYSPTPGDTHECLLRYAEYWAWGATPGHARKLIDSYPLPASLQALLNLNCVGDDWAALRHIPDAMKSVELIERALEQSGFAISYAPAHLLSECLALLAVQKDGRSLEGIPALLRTLSVCSEAVLNDLDAMVFVPEPIQAQLM